jgi:hypothetical protein
MSPFRRQKIAADAGDLSEFSCADDAVEFRQLFKQIPLIALCQTTSGDQHSAGTKFFQLGMLQDRINRLLFGFFDEPACIDDDDLSLLGVSGQLKPVCGKRPEHDLRIDLILRAAQVDEAHGGFFPGA